MTLPPVALTPLEPGQRRVMHITAIIPALAMIAAGIGAGVGLGHALEWPFFWPPLVVLVPLALWTVLIAPRRRWEAWGWALAEDELHVAWGVWTQSPHHRAARQGAAYRCGAGAVGARPSASRKLIVHTAGTAHATVVLPGITRETAEGLRDTIRQHIRSDPW